MATTIDRLQIDVNAAAAGAVDQIERLSTVLGTLRKNSNITKAVNSLTKLHDTPSPFPLSVFKNPFSGLGSNAFLHLIFMIKLHKQHITLQGAAP